MYTISKSLQEKDRAHHLCQNLDDGFLVAVCVEILESIVEPSTLSVFDDDVEGPVPAIGQSSSETGGTAEALESARAEQLLKRAHRSVQRAARVATACSLADLKASGVFASMTAQQDWLMSSL
jgi:hypothetical protein